MPYAFMVGPDGHFGIYSDRWVPLHTSVEGWVESLALVGHATLRAEKITRITGADVDALPLGGFEEVSEVAGVSDTWWRGHDSLVAIYRGEARCFSHIRHQRAYVYSGLSDRGPHY